MKIYSEALSGQINNSNSLVLTLISSSYYSLSIILIPNLALITKSGKIHNN